MAYHPFNKGLDLQQLLTSFKTLAENYYLVLTEARIKELKLSLQIVFSPLKQADNYKVVYKEHKF